MYTQTFKGTCSNNVEKSFDFFARVSKNVILVSYNFVQF